MEKVSIQPTSNNAFENGRSQASLRSVARAVQRGRYAAALGGVLLGRLKMKLLVKLSAYVYMLLTSAGAFAAENAMTAGDLQQICLGSSAESKAACRFYILGIAQGIDLGMNIADGKTRGGRPCIPENLSGSALELAVKMKMGEALMVFPDDRKLDASGFVGAIFVKTFPCRKQN